MAKKIIIFILVAYLTLGIFLIRQNPTFTQIKKVVMIVAQTGFRDEELLVPKEILEEAGFEVIVASSSLEKAKGMLGAVVYPDITIEEIDAKDYEAIIFVGGVGASQFWGNPIAHRIAQEAVREERLLGAICIAPIILARAGVLEGKRATVWFSEKNQLKAKGAIYTASSVEIHGNIITANGPGAAKEFGEAILDKLK